MSTVVLQKPNKLITWGAHRLAYEAGPTSSTRGEHIRHLAYEIINHRETGRSRGFASSPSPQSSQCATSQWRGGRRPPMVSGLDGGGRRPNWAGVHGGRRTGGRIHHDVLSFPC
ncbi:hypothetical protein DAI22_04g092350 [Oryza sativa Japonica Group]|nr:hypothetical protein DAI22_04g092350 [Oryza sativa Japonica Group]